MNIKNKFGLNKYKNDPRYLMFLAIWLSRRRFIIMVEGKCDKKIYEKTFDVEKNNGTLEVLLLDSNTEGSCNRTILETIAKQLQTIEGKNKNILIAPDRDYDTNDKKTEKLDKNKFLYYLDYYSIENYVLWYFYKNENKNMFFDFKLKDSSFWENKIRELRSKRKDLESITITIDHVIKYYYGRGLWDEFVIEKEKKNHHETIYNSVPQEYWIKVLSEVKDKIYKQTNLL